MKNRKSLDESRQAAQSLDKTSRTAMSRKMRLMYFQVGFIGLLVAVLLWYAMNTGSRIVRQYSPLVVAAMEIKLEATTAHLWLEEIISHDHNEDIEQVWDHLDQAEWYAQAMLDGNQNEEGTYIALHDSELRSHILEVLDDIEAFREIAEERLSHSGSSAVGSDIDQRFDEVFRRFLQRADEVEVALQQVMSRDLKRFRAVQFGLLVLCLVLSGLVAGLLHRFLRRQSIDLEKLNTSNKLLRSSEQQLEASNQQLRASEQQLKASNQQLLAGEQQLLASNQQLRQSQQKLSLHLQNTPLAVIQWDLDFLVAEWNNSAEKIFGYTREEAIGRHAAGLIVPESAKEVVDEVWRGLLAQEGGTRSTNENITKELKTVMCDWYNTPLIDENGNVVGVASLVLDITERIRAEVALRESKNKHLEAQRIAAIGHYVLDVKTGNLTNSVELDTIFGTNDSYQKDVAGWLNLVHPDYVEEMSSYLQDHVLGQHRQFDKEYKIVDAATGAEKWVHGLGSLKIDKNGDPIEMFGTIQDITARKRTEQNARDLARIVETSLNEIFIFDAETFKFLHINNGARNNIGYSEEELADMTPLDIKPEFTKEAFLRIIEPLRSGAKEIITFDTVHRRKDGSHYSVEVHLQLSTYHDKPVFVAIILDITETKRLQNLESRASRLELAGRIAGQVAHDFNNLLGPIMAYPELIHDELSHNSKAHAFLDAIEDAGEKIANINQDLLTMGRRGHYNQSALDLNRVVLQAAQEMESRIDTISVELKLCEDLMKVKGGSAQIHRILTNLLVNAQDAMRDIGRVTIKSENYYADDTSISFGRVPKGEYVKLTITDTGCGIPDDITQKILDPFFTTKVTDKRRGSGLGLSVVDAVMKDHDGYLDLASQVGHGTSFFLYFPVTREGVEENEAELSAVRGTEKILVVDDDEIQRKVSMHLLSKLGYEVTAVESGEKAIEFLLDNSQHLVILDMVMPSGIDGTETYRRMLKISPNQKAIILSGFSESEKVLEVQKLGAGAFVKKPVTKQVIAAAVRFELDRPVGVSAS